MKFIFRTTVRVSCISGSKSPHPEKRKKGITPIISLNEIRLNAIFMLIVFISIKTIYPQKIIGLSKNLVNSYLKSYAVEKAILNINCTVLQELWILLARFLTVKN